ncbi:hypothetical protein BN134_2532 [Cronobacter dublinensis 1210]|uniref:Uncharacterized protein n=1 Tax=Cronobacter dublinensis 1210 TaxID=1208656 RepID=A0ABP1WB63_9ENTR|nr:hypothetical protein BN134_2532 [Cronobacter dublinensis 1210]
MDAGQRVFWFAVWLVVIRDKVRLAWSVGGLPFFGLDGVC